MLTFAQTESWNTAKYEQGSWYYIISYTLHCTFKLWENQQPQRNTSPARMVLAKMQRYPKAYHLSCYIGSSSNSANGYFFVKEVHDGSWQFPTGIPREFQGSMDTKGLHPNQPSSGLLCVIIRLLCRVLSPFWNSYNYICSYLYHIFVVSYTYKLFI